MSNSVLVSDSPRADFSFDERRVLLKRIEKLENELARSKSPWRSGYFMIRQGKKVWDFLNDLKKYNRTYFDIWFFLASNVSYDNIVEVDQQTIADEIGKSIITVKRGIKYLKDHNFIGIEKSGRFSSNIYVMNRDLIWKGYKNNQGRCKVFGAIILSKESLEDDE